jgi:hypothetical protein
LCPVRSRGHPAFCSHIFGLGPTPQTRRVAAQLLGFWRSPKQWLGVDVPLDMVVEVLDAVDRERNLPIEAGNDVITCVAR